MIASSRRRRFSHHRQADVVVVGGGLAGTTAAAVALECGQKVTLLEKSGRDLDGSNSARSGGVVHVAFEGLATPSQLRERLADLPHSQARAELSDAFAANLRSATEWLAAQAVGFGPLEPRPESPFAFSPLPTFATAASWREAGPVSGLVQLQDSFARRGGQVYFQAQAIELIASRERRAVVGIRARDEQGRIGDLYARQVILADGGFQANPTLVRQHIGRFADQAALRGAAGGTGDGMRMAEALGAATVNTQFFYGHLLHREALGNERLATHPELDHLATAGVVVDRRGERFVDESGGGIAIANALARGPDPRGAWVICDETTWQTHGGRGHGLIPIPLPHSLEERGASVHRAESIRELACASSLDPDTLERTVGAYNDAADKGTTRSLPVERAGEAEPIRQPPFYAIPTIPGMTFTMGGLLIDRNACVIDVDGRAIDGLYAAGSSAGGLHGGGQSYVGGLAAALTFGFIAGSQGRLISRVETAGAHRAPVTNGALTRG